MYMPPCVPGGRCTRVYASLCTVVHPEVYTTRGIPPLYTLRYTTRVCLRTLKTVIYPGYASRDSDIGIYPGMPLGTLGEVNVSNVLSGPWVRVNVSNVLTLGYTLGM